MQRPLSYRHRVITDDDLVFIRRLIAENPDLSRRGLSIKLCEVWNWVQANVSGQSTAPLAWGMPM